MYRYVPVHTILPDPVQVYRIPDALASGHGTLCCQPEWLGRGWLFKFGPGSGREFGRRRPLSRRRRVGARQRELDPVPDVEESLSDRALWRLGKGVQVR
jgi:hypothetical protein